MRHYILFILFFIASLCSAQRIHTYDYVIDMHYYKSYYSKSIKGPSFVIYKLYKGGGDASRASFNFKGYRDLPYFNYAKSGYDRGHLVPAEDYADTKVRLRSTFYYINCVPQTPNLNRGIWKRYETHLRKLSQTDSLLIICGGCDYPRAGNNDSRCIPTNCFKVVYNLKTKTCLYALLFTNQGTASSVKYSEQLTKIFTYRKAMNLYRKEQNY